MVSKIVTYASLLMPVAMLVGTGIAIVAYSYSQTVLSIVIIICTVLLTILVGRNFMSQTKRRL